MIKSAITSTASKKKGRLVTGRVEVLLHAEEVIEKSVVKALAGSGLTQAVSFKRLRATRAATPLERELLELRQIVDALAVRSVAHDQEARIADSIDMESMTLLDADTAYHLLDNPGEPNEALSAILALR